MTGNCAKTATILLNADSGEHFISCPENGSLRGDFGF